MAARFRGRVAALIGGVGLAGLLPVPLAFGGEHEHEHGHGPAHNHHQPFLEARPPLPHTHEMAGYPLCVSPLAHPTNTDRYRGGYVGGGTHHGGHGRCAQEGTWGWDYVGLRPHGARIFNNWSHGRRFQGGYGKYATEGPKPLEHLKESIHGHAGRE